MKGKPMTATSVSLHESPHMKTKWPTALMQLRRKTLTFCEMRSLTCVVSADRREMMSPGGGEGGGGH